VKQECEWLNVALVDKKETVPYSGVDLDFIDHL